MNTRSRYLVSALAAAALLLSGWIAVSKVILGPKEQLDDPACMLEIMEIPSGRVLYVVVDADGVYLGEQRFDLDRAGLAVSGVLKREGIKNVFIYGTEGARYGDVIQIFASLQRPLVDHRSFSYYPLPDGTRKPMTGLWEARCCSPIDVENDQPGE